MRSAAWPCPGQVCSEGGSPRSGTHLRRAGKRPAALPEPHVGSWLSQRQGGAGKGVREDGSPSVSWHITAGVQLYGRRAAAIPFPKSAWETILGTALAYTSLHTHTAPAAAQGEAGGPSRTRRNERTAGPQGQGLNRSQTGLCTHQPLGPHGTGLVSHGQSRRGCQPLAQLEESGWGSAPGMTLLPLREPGRRCVNRQAV